MAERLPYSLKKLDWDTEFFGIPCAKAVLTAPLADDDWSALLQRASPYTFVSIENRNSEPSNARRIGMESRAFLADINVQFEKKLKSEKVSESEPIPTVQIYEAMERDDRILDMSGFEHSKFITDPELRRRGGDRVYREWLGNAFGKPDKFFAVARDRNGETAGYILYSYSDKTCTIELISVSGVIRKAGVGSAMFRAVEQEAFKRGCDTLHVGTQLRNTSAVNFYHKCGCKQTGCHSVYHLWTES
jgi:ribosomal protein S18 acetylase RimI-like enzyme